MRAVPLPLLPVDRESLVVPDNVPRVVASSPCDDCWVVNRNGENAVFGMEERVPVLLELSEEEARVPPNGVIIPAIPVVGIVFTEGTFGSVGKEKDVGVILENTSVVSEVMETEANIVLFEVGPAFVTGVTPCVDVCMVMVVLGLSEDNKVENKPTVVEVSEEAAGGEKTELLTNIEDIGPDVAIEGLLKQSGCDILED